MKKKTTKNLQAFKRKPHYLQLFERHQQHHWKIYFIEDREPVGLKIWNSWRNLINGEKKQNKQTCWAICDCVSVVIITPSVFRVVSRWMNTTCFTAQREMRWTISAIKDWTLVWPVRMPCWAVLSTPPKAPPKPTSTRVRRPSSKSKWALDYLSRTCRQMLAQRPY